MKYTVELKGVAIGRSELERPDPGTGFVRGDFNPATGYQLVQDVFRLYAEAVPKTPGGVADAEKLQRYYRARDALGLELAMEDGRLVPGATIHIFEKPGKPNRLELEVHVPDGDFWVGRNGDA